MRTAAVLIAVALGCGGEKQGKAVESAPAPSLGEDESKGQLARTSRGARFGSDAGPDDPNSAVEKRPQPKPRWGDYELKDSKRITIVPYEPGYSPGSVGDHGAVSGRVTIRDGLVAPRPSGCESVARAAIVYLAGIHRGRYFFGEYRARAVKTGGLVELTRCGATPRLQVVAPTTAAVEFVWQRQQAGKVSLTRIDRKTGPETLAFGSRADRRTKTMVGPGFVEARITGDNRASLAHLALAGNPYFVVTDAKGRFVLDEIPPGTYDLVVWYPPAARKGGTRPAITQRKKVTIKAGAVSKASFQIVTR